MAELKTQKNDANVQAFIEAIADERKRQDCRDLVQMMQEATGDEPAMWGKSIVGFGSYRYRYASGREGEWFLTGFAPRKQNLTLYIMSGFDAYDDLLSRLGKHTTGVSCLYVKRLSDVDRKVLEQLIRASVEHMARTNSGT